MNNLHYTQWTPPILLPDSYFSTVSLATYIRAHIYEKEKKVLCGQPPEHA